MQPHKLGFWNVHLMERVPIIPRYGVMAALIRMSKFLSYQECLLEDKIDC